MRHALLLATLGVVLAAAHASPSDIPLPEHPRPGFQRAEWVNLNGPWRFRFDTRGVGEDERWFDLEPTAFRSTILVPFPWGSALSGVADEGDVGWYGRRVRVPEAWRGKRVFLCVGASDWRTTAWLDGQPLGTHQGGYTPFELELTDVVSPGDEHRLILRVDDSPHPFKLEGKQGYGPARGLWQTLYLEARPAAFVDSFELRPDLGKEQVEVRVRLGEGAEEGTMVAFELGRGEGAVVVDGPMVPRGESRARFVVPVPDPRVWSLVDPHLYDAAVLLRTPDGEDRVETYLGMREISTVPLPGHGHSYVALNGRPVYLQMALDQGWHPEGFTTWPSDEVMRDEVLLARRLGLNALRTHVKIEPPRKLYWADRLGVLVMADVPNSWGEPDAAMRKEWEHALRGMVRRDFNHPSIFSWVLFNETWGLRTADPDEPEKKVYLPETKAWLASRVEMTRDLDPTRLVEDNSVCCGVGHVTTDLNTWHAYLPGWRWREKLEEAEAGTFEGSGWNYEEGWTQGKEPMLNSECGNVWGYEGSTGDVDWSFDYHAMIDEFRRHPKVAGWLYTEHHDVVNEWNGYVRADRSAKETGFGELVPGMSLADLHSPIYVSMGSFPTASVQPGEVVAVALWASFLTDRVAGGDLTLRFELVGHDDLGRFRRWWEGERAVPFEAWMSRELEPVAVPMPPVRSVALLRLVVEDQGGRALHRNFTAFVVGEGTSERDEVREEGGRILRILRAAPSSFSEAPWSVRQWDAMDGLKVNGSGVGAFEYRIPWPDDLRPEEVVGATFVAELGAKELFGKDRPGAGSAQGDYMRGRGAHDPGLNPNAYPMTDTVTHPSAVRVRVNGTALGVFDLADDPADHRGLLSWHFQERDGWLREAGSYGELVSVTVPDDVLAASAPAGEITVRLEVDGAVPGGLAVYGERFGRYPLDPMVVLRLRR